MNEGTLATIAIGGVSNQKPGVALAALLALHQNFPTDPAHLMNAAGILSLLDMPAEALAFLDAADSIGGDFGTPMGFNGKAIALNNRGHALLELGQWSQAQTVLQQALALEPLLAEGRANLGIALLCQGNTVQGAQNYRAGQVRSAGNPFDLSAGTSANLPPLDYPAGPEKLVAFATYYGQLDQLHGQRIQSQNAQLDTLLSEIASRNQSSPPPLITAVRTNDIASAAFAYPNDLYAAQTAAGTAVDNLTESTDAEILGLFNPTPATLPAYQAAQQKCATIIKQEHPVFLAAQHDFEQKLRTFVETWHKQATALDANLSDQLEHDKLAVEIDQLTDVQFFAAGLVGRAKFYTDTMGGWWRGCQPNDDQPASENTVAPNGAHSQPCPAELTSATVSLDLLGIFSIDFNCEKVKAGISLPLGGSLTGLSAFGQVEYKQGGEWTGFMGFKAGLPGTPFSGKEGIYIKGTNDSFTDAGIKFSSSGAIGPLKIDFPAGLEIGVVAARYLPTALGL